MARLNNNFHLKIESIHFIKNACLTITRATKLLQKTTLPKVSTGIPLILSFEQQIVLLQ